MSRLNREQHKHWSKLHLRMSLLLCLCNMCELLYAYAYADVTGGLVWQACSDKDEFWFLQRKTAFCIAASLNAYQTDV